jgi:hypothetical protein
VVDREHQVQGLELWCSAEPPTRSLIVCTTPTGIKGATRRYAMTSGHP